MVIINLQGTGGAGKSTIVRKIMSRYHVRTPEFIDGRRRPVGYRLSAEARTLYVPGHYETPCGGCDTITKVEDVFALVHAAAARGEDVLYEGIISQDAVPRTLALAHDYPSQLFVIALDVPLEVCLASIQARRDASGTIKPLNPKNTTARERSLRTRMERFKVAGIHAGWMTREAALAYCLWWLGVENQPRVASGIGTDDGSFQLR